jgi:pimeloyl-ACP methyl ester carboxylesterase
MAGLRLPDGRLLGFAEYGDPGGVSCLDLHATPGSRLDPRVLFARSPVAMSGIRLVAVDRPGFGVSGRQPGAGFDDFPCDVVAVADHLGLDRFAVLGVSGGGGYALACAYAVPERVRAAVAGGMTPVSGPADWRGLALGHGLVYRLAGSAPWLAQALMTLAFRATVLALRRSVWSPGKTIRPAVPAAGADGSGPAVAGHRWTHPGSHPAGSLNGIVTCRGK